MAYRQGQRVESTNPRRITLTKILVFLGVAAVVYFSVTYVPPYWRYYKAKEIIVDAANKGYATRRQTDEWDEIEEKMRKRIHQALVDSLKVEPQELYVSVKHEEREIFVKTKWTTYAKWPFIGKRTTLKFKEDFKMPAR